MARVNKTEACRILRAIDTGQKTAVTVVMELGTQLHIQVEFQEDAALKWDSDFKFNVRLGDISATGCGRSKKEAKQNSAQEILDIIRNYGENIDRSSSPVVGVVTSGCQSPLSYSSPSPSSSSMLDTPSSTSNSVGELQNLSARKRWALPEYLFDEPEGEPHRRTFTCLVKMMSGLECTGTGSTKKAAKKQAAEKMLNILQGDTVDSGIPESSPGSPNAFNRASTPDTSILEYSDLEGYNSSSSQSSSPSVEASVNHDDTYDDTSVAKLESRSKKEGFNIEYIFLPNKSKKGLHQVFVKLKFDQAGGIDRPPVVTHGSGETQNVACCKGAERALTHLEILMSLP